MNKDLFRREALSKLEEPEQLDRLMVVITPKSWLVLAALWLMVIVGLGWSVFGRIPDKVSGPGILLEAQGVANLAHNAGGRVEAVYVTAGQTVAKGQVVARLAQPLLDMEIGKTRETMAKARDSYEYADQQAILQQMKDKFSQDAAVVSPVDGRVVEVKARAGDILEAGVPLVTVVPVQTDAGGLTALLYIPAEQGKKVEPGMEVRIAPSVAQKEEYGYVVGKVTAVSEYPVTAAGMLRDIGSRELVQKFTGGGKDTPVEVRVRLLPDTASPSGYQWTSRQGSPVRLQGGTLCEGAVIVKQQQPIALVFLRLNRLLEGE